MKIIATINLGQRKGRGQLFVKNGDVWLRRPDGASWPTQTVDNAHDLMQACKVIHEGWGDRHWDLEFAEAS